MAENTEQDKQFVVVVNGKRSSGTMTENQANAEAQKRRDSISESKAQPAPKVEVKRNLCG